MIKLELLSSSKNSFMVMGFVLKGRSISEMEIFWVSL